MRRPNALVTAFVCSAALAVLVGLSGCGLFEDPDPSTTTLAPPPERNLPYGDPVNCAPGDAECANQQTLDIYRSDAPDPNPVVVWVHGGGFISGNKDESTNESLQTQLDDGWDVVSVNYRLATDDPSTAFPAGLLDVKRAVRWVKANAAAQGWNPDAVAAMGISAGGNLVEMLAVTSGQPGLEPTNLSPEMSAVDSSIIAVVSLSAVSDMGVFVQDGTFTDAVQAYLDCTDDCPPKYPSASVQTYVDANAAPILAIHGIRDTVAPPEQGELVKAAYDAAGIGDRFKMIVVSTGPEKYQGHNPDMPEWQDDISAFLADALTRVGVESP